MRDHNSFMRTLGIFFLAWFVFLNVPLGAEDKKQEDNQKDKKADRLRQESRNEFARLVFGEKVKTVRPLPCYKKSTFHIKAGESIKDEPKKKEEKDPFKAIDERCQNPIGTKLRITKLEYKDKEIIVDLNGGSNLKKGWRQRIAEHMQIGMGGAGVPIPTTTTTTNPNNNSQSYEAQAPGSTIVLEFGRPLPDMTADELKQYLSVLLDFSKQSAVVQWIDSIPPEFKDAIKEKRVAVGMDKEMVVAAIGNRHLSPIRELEKQNGVMVEVTTWIYETIPSDTFVKFVDNVVISVTTWPKNPVDKRPSGKKTRIIIC